MQAGPSTGRIPRRRERAGDFSEIYARLNNAEARSQNMEDATTITIQELRQDIDRIDSNLETQKKFFGQQLARVGDQAQSALDLTGGLQEQMDGVRQQASEMHKSLGAIHEHSCELTKGLGKMMEKFERLSFDLPNILDHWMNIRETAPTTVTGAQLHQGAVQFKLPPLPSIPELVQLLQSHLHDLHQQTHGPDNPPPPLPKEAPPPLESPEDSPSKLFSRFFYSQPLSSQGLGLTVVKEEAETQGEPALGPDRGQSADPGVRPSPVPDNLPPAESSPGSSGSLFPHYGYSTGLSVVGAEKTPEIQEQDVPRQESEEVAVTGTVGKVERKEDEDAVQGLLSAIEEEADSQPPSIFTAPPHTPPSSAVGRQGTPDALSPELVREQSVPPPVGMLSSSIGDSTAAPDCTSLQTALHGDDLAAERSRPTPGPVTRSRSRTRSIGISQNPVCGEMERGKKGSHENIRKPTSRRRR